MASERSKPIAYLSRRYHFSAAHRLHTERYDAERNREVYGKCNNPFGHGHNYVVQVTLRGPVDPVTGMVCDLGALDAFAHTNLLDRFDHVNLNTLECFAETVSTTENLAIEVHRIFGAFPLAKLDRVHVEETSNNSFDLVDGDGHRGGHSPSLL
jgi:6-pyruvoyltetrahydropterin/6-carboxytetrahydropterin synthase